LGLEESPVEGQSLLQKDKKRRKRKAKKEFKKAKSLETLVTGLKILISACSQSKLS